MNSNQSFSSRIIAVVINFITAILIGIFFVIIIQDEQTKLISSSSRVVVSAQTSYGGSSSSSLSSLSWQGCSTFLTPSSSSTDDNGRPSWAVYAGRNFKAEELVELTPFFIPLEMHRTKHSVLDDYVFSFLRPTKKASSARKRTTTAADNTTTSDESESFESSKLDSDSNLDDVEYNVVLLGNGAFYNHHPEPNLKYVQIVRREDGGFLQHGGGDDDGNNNSNVFVDVPHLVGFRATRDIVAGEQLYVSFGKTTFNYNNHAANEDNVVEWFEKRGLLDEQAKMMTKTEEYIESDMLPFYLSKHCSKIYAGVGLPTWRDNILPILASKRRNNMQELPDKNKNNDAEVFETVVMDPTNWMDLSRLAPFDAGLSDARAKVSIRKGDRIEKSLGLVLSRNHVRKTPLGPIAFYWENLKVDHHQYLINLRDESKLVLQYQGIDTNWESVDRFIGYSEITILPVSGNIGLVRRVGGSNSNNNEEYNCKLMIRSNNSKNDHHANKVGVTLELIATKDIPAGEVLKLNIAPSEFDEEYKLLHDEMEQSGQPHHPGIFDLIEQIISSDDEEL